ncbi:hypothetical protein [Methylobacterium dankookense]|uniref:Uncharacterized protein n=1 Tax=Methylobacterium dankookense TaxID=560405 RepID=A0A564G7Q0_9HYPH|nr:hypothetical protein [Methylobacterium dankookense]GJD59423.1 hypothetical protein IFDJLNFL_5351 [Methylobacterium dankookense]VUF15958.1 hypothetical protein MTDSW087_05707 [Methylobacterium dankookense]
MKAPPLSVDDPAQDCPVPVEALGRLARAAPEAVAELVASIPEATRARLAVYLYGRSHTYELGIRIAATCDGPSLRRAAGLVGTTLYDLSRRPYAPPAYGAPRTSGAARISLGGPRLAARG